MAFVGTFPLFDTSNLSIVSDGDDHSVLVVKVYQRHRIGKDKLIAALTHTIGEVLHKLKNGGTRTVSDM